jgi:hypothetical protein
MVTDKTGLALLALPYHLLGESYHVFVALTLRFRHKRYDEKNDKRCAAHATPGITIKTRLMTTMSHTLFFHEAYCRAKQAKMSADSPPTG